MDSRNNLFYCFCKLLCILNLISALSIVEVRDFLFSIFYFYCLTNDRCQESQSSLLEEGKRWRTLNLSTQIVWPDVF